MAEPRVLHVNDQSGWGGGESQTWLLIRELERLGVENHALVRGGSALEARLADVLPAGRLHRLRPFLWPLLPLLLPDLPGRAVLHAHTGRATQAFAAPRAVRWPKVAHRRIPDLPTPGGLRRLARADAVICVSEGIRTALATAGGGRLDPGRLRVVHSSADVLPVPQGPLPLEGDPVLGYLGWFRHHKGLDLLLEALPAVRRVHPRVVLHLVGAGEEEARLRSRAASPELADAVRFHPFQSEPGPWLAAFDLFVLPSREEGLGSVALQAQALGVPVLGTRTGGLPEGVAHGRTGWLVEAGDPKALTAGLLDALGDRERLARWAAGAPAWVAERFRPEAMARGTLEIYRELWR